jgi:hypothetical protein
MLFEMEWRSPLWYAPLSKKVATPQPKRPATEVKFESFRRLGELTIAILSQAKGLISGSAILRE